MNKKKLSRYFWLQHEITNQRKRLIRLQAKRDKAGDIVADTVNDYRTGKARTIKIEGVADEDYKIQPMINVLKKEIEHNISESETIVIEIEKYIQDIDDPKLREILRSRFIDCETWEKVGKNNYIAPDYARRIIRDFFKNK